MPNTIAVFASSQSRDRDGDGEIEVERDTEREGEETWAAKLWFTCKFSAKRKLFLQKTKDSNLNRCFLCCFEWCLSYLLLHFGSVNSLHCEQSKNFSSYLSIVSDGTWSSACFFVFFFSSFFDFSLSSTSLALMIKHNKAVTQISRSSDQFFCVSSRFVRCKCFLLSYKDNDEKWRAKPLVCSNLALSLFLSLSEEPLTTCSQN